MSNICNAFGKLSKICNCFFENTLLKLKGKHSRFIGQIHSATKSFCTEKSKNFQYSAKIGEHLVSVRCILVLKKGVNTQKRLCRFLTPEKSNSKEVLHDEKNSLLSPRSFLLFFIFIYCTCARMRTPHTRKRGNFTPAHVIMYRFRYLDQRRKDCPR